MKRNTKNYYDIHFDSLKPLSEAEMNELCMYESWLPDLPSVLFFPETATRIEKQEKKRLHGHFRTELHRSQN
jgi:hypothetical protein